jgi:DNA polymerase elongation subunit (family B)
MSKSKGKLGPRILTIDIETSPNMAHVWSLWNVNVGLNQLLESGEVICFAAKWYGEKKVHFYSNYHDGHEVMIEAAHNLLNEADIVVHYNGKRFDIPHLNREFLEAGFEPPAPYVQVDLFQTAKSKFRFPSNKLDYIAQTLNIGAKTQHAGHQLWLDCLAGDKKAWKTMKEYNIHDVELTERLYDKLLPWIHPHPNVNLYSDVLEEGCPNCGGTDLRREGYSRTALGVYQRYQCKGCGKWSRDKHKLGGVDVRGVS